LLDYRSGKVQAFDKKRQIETNTIGISNDFDALKSRIIASNQKFKKFQFGSQNSTVSDDFATLNSTAQKKKTVRYQETISKSDIKFAAQS